MVTIVRVVAELMQLAEGTGTGAREAMTLGRVHSWPRRWGTVGCLRASRTAAASSADAPHRQTQVPRVLRSVDSPCITIAPRTCRCKSLRTVRFACRFHDDCRATRRGARHVPWRWARKFAV